MYSNTGISTKKSMVVSYVNDQMWVLKCSDYYRLCYAAVHNIYVKRGRMVFLIKILIICTNLTVKYEY